MKTKYETVEFVPAGTVWQYDKRRFVWMILRLPGSNRRIGGIRYVEWFNGYSLDAQDVYYSYAELLDIGAFLKQLNSKGESDAENK